MVSDPASRTEYIGFKVTKATADQIATEARRLGISRTELLNRVWVAWVARGGDGG